jgi:hypothetical protein
VQNSNWASNRRLGVCLRALALAKDFVVSLLRLLRALFAKHLQRPHGWLARCGPFPRIPTPLHRHHHNRLRNASCALAPRGHASSSTALPAAELRRSSGRAWDASSNSRRCCRLDGPQTTRHASDNKVRCPLAAASGCQLGVP